MKSARLSVGFVFLLLAAGLAAYHNSFSVPFLLDDVFLIVENPHVLAPEGWRALLTTWTRPTVLCSLALNHALGGLHVWGYHAFNLAVHLAAALTLFGILRRSLLSPCFQGRYHATAPWLAFTATLLWTVHPLHTQSVTYIIQRSEALAGFFCLLTLYCAIRAATSSKPAAWTVAAILSCALGVGSKATAAVTPLAVLLYDRTFLSGSFRRALRARKPLTLGLAASWGLLAALQLLLEVDHPTAGFSYEGITPLRYAATQPAVILHYLRLAFWPHPLVFDYAWPPVRSAMEAAGPALGIAALAVVTAWAYRRQPGLGFWGVWFFLTLAPSSSFIPVADLAQEYRMYLPLAGMITLAVIGGWELIDRFVLSASMKRAVLIGGIILLAAGSSKLTIQRNAVYQTPLTLWQDTVAKRPSNARAHNNLGKALADDAQFAQTRTHYQEAIRLRPHYADAHSNLGVELDRQGLWAEAITHYTKALRLNPHLAATHNNLGAVYHRQGHLEKAVAHYTRALQIKPDLVEAHNHLGMALQKQGRLAEAIHHYRQALQLNPRLAEIHNNLGLLLHLQGQLHEASVRFEEAIRLTPNDAKGYNNLGNVLDDMGRSEEAIAYYKKALERDPSLAVAHYNLGIVLKQQGRISEALAHFEQALRLDPKLIQRGSGLNPQAEMDKGSAL